MHWIPKEEWGQIETITQDFAKKLERAFILPEGAPLFECFLGALSLTLDILRNEETLGVTFQHICMEVGMGYSAAALLLGLSFLERPTRVHLLHVAEEEAAFLKRLKSLHAAFESWLGCPVPFPSNYSALPKLLAPSFGATNAHLFAFIKETARSEGLFLDPVYSAKLFYSVKEARISGGPALLIHSGGALSLSGFQKSL
jgi:1-aminocyclopropane-1-carboxylate deaminase/D-cysteine desulfhydrase-like pyridoxal-dependent ACC family enzyme